MQKLGEGAEVRVVELPATASPRLRAGVAMADVHWGGRVVKFGSMYAPSDAKERVSFFTELRASGILTRDRVFWRRT